MKIAKSLAVAVVTFGSIPLVAQQVKTEAQQDASGSAASAHVTNSANAGASADAANGQAETHGAATDSLTAGYRHANAGAAGSDHDYGQMRPVSGGLESKLDSKTAKPGDQVLFKTSEKMKICGRAQLFPKGRGSWVT